MRRRRVLMVSFDFPPARTSGIYRPIKLVKYLPEHGWEPVVLTTENHPSAVRDDTVTRGLPDRLEVHRARYVPVLGFEELLSRLVVRRGVSTPSPRADGRATEQASSPTVPGNGGPYRPSIGRRALRRFLLHPGRSLAFDLLCIPDDRNGWLPAANRLGARLVQQGGIDAVWTTAPPPSSLLVGLYLKRRFGVPWVADYRDWWYHATFVRYLRTLRRHVDGALERSILSHVDRVVTMSDEHSAFLLEYYPFLRRSQVVAVPNGFDPADQNREPLPAATRDGPLVIQHMGTVYPGFADEFLDALAEIKRLRPRLAGEFKVRFVGFLDMGTRRRIAELGLDDCVEQLPFVPQAEAMRLMRASDLLLVVRGGHWVDVEGIGVPGKLYSYMLAGRPVLAVSRPGTATARLVREGRLGWTVDPDDLGAIGATIEGLVRRKREGRLTLQANQAFVEQFNWRELGAKMAETLESACTGSRDR